MMLVLTCTHQAACADPSKIKEQIEIITEL